MHPTDRDTKGGIDAINVLYLDQWSNNERTCKGEMSRMEDNDNNVHYEKDKTFLSDCDFFVAGFANDHSSCSSESNDSFNKLTWCTAGEETQWIGPISLCSTPIRKGICFRSLDFDCVRSDDSSIQLIDYSTMTGKRFFFYEGAPQRPAAYKYYTR